MYVMNEALKKQQLVALWLFATLYKLIKFKNVLMLTGIGSQLILPPNLNTNWWRRWLTDLVMWQAEPL